MAKHSLYERSQNFAYDDEGDGAGSAGPSASANVNAVTQDLHAMIADAKNGKGSVGALLRDTAFSADLQETLAKIKTVGDKAAGLGKQLDEIVGTIRSDIDSR